MFTGIIIALFILSFFIQLVYICFFSWCRLSYTVIRDLENSTASLPLSIIICARNEAENLQKNLVKILEQEYKDNAGNLLFEVIVVNDHSEDNTAQMLEQIKLNYPHLIILNLTDGISAGKKNALIKGVELAQYNYLLFTDADCYPLSKSWIASMAKPFSGGKEIVSGYGAYLPENTFLNRFIRCETVHAFMQSYCYNRLGLPYTAVGRNLACSKSIFNKAIADPLFLKLPFGDDDLLVKTGADKNNMEVLYHAASFTISQGKKSWKEWLVQKQRHASTGKYYKSGVKFLLGLYGFSHAVLWITTFLCMLNIHLGGKYIAIVVSLFLANRVFTLLTLKSYASILREERISKTFFIFDPGWMLNNFVLAPFIFWKNKKQWK